MRNPTVATEGPLTPGLVAILQQIDAAAARNVERVLYRNRRTNLIAEIHLAGGTVLIIKRGRSNVAAERFATAHAASTLLRGLDLETPSTRLLLRDEPVLAYWRINRPTLHESWGGASTQERERLLQSWGQLLQRLHDFTVRGVGSLADPSARNANVRDYLYQDIVHRLLPALSETLPDAVRAAARLVDFARSLPDAPSIVVHNDVFDQNVLCDRQACTGLIDFEDAFAGPAEADFAKLELLHGPLFGQPWDGPWLTTVLTAYDRALNATMISAFRCYALLNMGCHGMTIGLTEHSRTLASVAVAEAEFLERGVSHHEAVRARRLP